MSVSPVPADPRIEAAAAALSEKRGWLEWGGVARVAVEAIDRLAAVDAVLTPPEHNAYADPAGGGWHGYQAACHDCDWRSENVYDHPPGGGAKEAAQTEAREHEATMARAAVVSPPDTPTEYEPVDAIAEIAAARVAYWHPDALDVGPSALDFDAALFIANQLGPVFRRVVRDENEHTK